MFFLVCVFLKVTFERFLKVLFCAYSDEKLEKHITEYQNYLIAKD